MIESRRPSPVRSFLPVLVAGLALAAATVRAQDARPIPAAEAWLKLYVAGKLDLNDPRIKTSSPGVRFGVVTSIMARSIGHLRELEMICEVLTRTRETEAVEALLAVAAVGLESGRKYEVAWRPNIVREIGEQQLDTLKRDDAWATIVAAAESLPSGNGQDAARCAAAIRALGRRQDETWRPHLEAGLAASSLTIRMSAADAAGASKLKTTIPALCAALRAEEEESARLVDFAVLLDLVEAHRDKIGDDDRRKIADCSIDSLGKGSWRTDLAAVDVLEKVRSARAVPALITVLARQSPDARDVDDEDRSGVLRERCHQVLRSLTGAVFPAEQPEQWQSWWDSVRDTFVLAEPKDGTEEEGRTVTGDFFGIPVRGSRILFVIDTSGSMAEAWRGQGTRTEKGTIKLDVAKRELLKAVSTLAPDNSFNLVWFGDEPKIWQRDMSEATDKAKKRFEKTVERLTPDGNTNLWGALQEGLRLESIVQGERYEVDFDELFVLSDGIPTRGLIRHPKEILLAVRETNRRSRLTINTVYISGDPLMEKRIAEQLGMSGAEFMKRLAEENSGKAVTL
jgi:hypothetical protein